MEGFQKANNYYHIIYNNSHAVVQPVHHIVDLTKGGFVNHKRELPLKITFGTPQYF
jgi:hypothetical protein